MSGATVATAVRERPILFSGPMVKAILDGRKTQTRRIVTPQPFFTSCQQDATDAVAAVAEAAMRRVLIEDRCPYGVPGDRLWVRETWAEFPTEGDYIYRADHDRALAATLRWRPSIFMPRAAGRLVLEVTEVRVQRLQETKESEARAEGIVLRDAPEDEFTARAVVAVDGRKYLSVGSAFAALWDSINAKRAPWSSNPWVWAISFRRIA